MTTTVEIPADVRDNSETVTDYAFSRDRSPDRGVRTPEQRDKELEYADLFRYTHYQWHGTAQGTRDGWGAGQRYRVDVLVNDEGKRVYLFVTMYWTRVPCAECEHSYASVYQLLTEEIDDEILDAVPRCDYHADRFRKLCAREGTELLESEPLRIGQH